MNLSLEQMDTKYAGLAWKFYVSPDSCANPEHYQNYIRLNAVADKASGKGTTHIFLDTDANRIAGFATFHVSSLINNSDGTSYGTPALEIAELAVDKDYAGNKIGTKLVQFAILLAENLNEHFAGVRYVILCADPQAVTFYSKEALGFKPVEDFYNVPRDGWNDLCTPMFIKIAKD